MTPTPSDTTPDVAVQFYWRPGCMFCMMLERRLAKRGMRLEKHNIWEEPEAAARVRVAAGGNETVPTVFVGDRALVNPAPKQVERLLAEAADIPRQ